jgi:hypothetical protein
LGDALGLRWVPSSPTGRKEPAVEAGSQDATRARERSPPKGATTLAIRAVIKAALFERKERSMRGPFRPLIACLLAVLLAVLIAGVASAQTQRSIVGPGESIQRAVNAAEPGDTILVRGTHRETVVIR